MTLDNEELTMKIIMEAGFFQDVVDALDAIVEEGKVNFLDNLIRIWMIDPGKVAGVYIDIKPDEYDQIMHYSVQNDGFTQGINLARLDKLLNQADADDPVQLEFGKKHKWRFQLSMPSIEAYIAGIDPESMREEPDRPGLDLPAQFTMSGESFSDAVKLNDMFSNFSTIAVEDHQVIFLAEGDQDSGKFNLEEGEGDLEFSQHPDERVESMFSMDYLKDLSKVLKNYDELQIKAGDEFPIMIDAGLFEYMVAPRISK